MISLLQWKYYCDYQKNISSNVCALCAKDLYLTRCQVFCSLGPFPPLLPCPWGLFGLPLHKWPLLPSRGYIRGCWCLTKAAPQGSCSWRWVSIRHCLWHGQMHTRAHSPVELRCGVGMSSWTHAWGLKESSWNKSCVYKGQLELQWQWRDWNIIPGTSYNWPWSSATPQELFLAHICVRPSILINRLKPLECINFNIVCQAQGSGLFTSIWGL